MEDQILRYVGEKGKVTAGELIDNLDVPRSSLFVKLDELVSEGKLIKIGNRPNVFYTLPSATSEKPDLNPTQITSSPSAPRNDTTPAPDSVYSEPLLYWCKFLRLDPKAVTESYNQIRPLVPNYQSVGLNPPKSKKLGLKMPDPIWVRFFNLLTWILAIVWTILKNCWALFRKFYKGEIPWGPIVMTFLAAWIIFGLIVPMFVKPKEHSPEKMVTDVHSKMLDLQVQTLSQELEDTHIKLERREDELRRLKSQLEAAHQIPTQMEELREELERTRQDYDQKLSDAKAKIRTLNKELIQSESQTSSLKYDLEREQSRIAKLKEEMEGLRRNAESK